MYLVIIDANVWIKFTRSKNILPLLDRFDAYNLVPVVNNYLLSEIFDALIDNKWMTDSRATATLEFIKRVASMQVERAVYRLSPDPKDNSLFYLAIQNNAAFIITDDTRLLSLKLKPRLIKSSSWFLKNFPV